MRRNLLVAACAGAGILCSVNTIAQVKGDPILSAPPQTVQLQKNGSRLSPELQKLADKATGARKQMTPAEKAGIPNDAMNQYMLFDGNRVVVDITINDNMR